MIKKLFLIFCLIFYPVNVYCFEKIITVDIDYIINNSKAGIFIKDQLTKAKKN